jgi:peptidoglycan/LPS O-acetylase OafA/YrhL
VGKRLGYVPALDGLRGVAIGLVALYHAGLLPGGFLGVDLFFVLSGFLITTLLLEEHALGGRINLVRFYSRRARRLLPALLMLLLVLTLYAVAVRPIDTRLLTDVGLTLGYVSNIHRAYFHHFTQPLSMMWSLAQEEQFYLVWPALLIVGLKRAPLRQLALGTGALILVVWLWRAGLVANGAPVSRLRFSPDTHADPLLIGCSVAFVSRLRSLPRLWPVAAAALAVEALLCGDASRFTLTLGLPIAGIACASLVADAAASGISVFELQPLVWLGRISYSVYVWQALAFIAAEQLGVGTGGIRVAALTFSVLLGWLSYRFVEEPFRRRRAMRAPRPAEAAA